MQKKLRTIRPLLSECILLTCDSLRQFLEAQGGRKNVVPRAHTCVMQPDGTKGRSAVAPGQGNLETLQLLI